MSSAMSPFDCHVNGGEIANRLGLGHDVLKVDVRRPIVIVVQQFEIEVTRQSQSCRLKPRADGL